MLLFNPDYDDKKSLFAEVEVDGQPVEDPAANEGGGTEDYTATDDTAAEDTSPTDNGDTGADNTEDGDDPGMDEDDAGGGEVDYTEGGDDDAGGDDGGGDTGGSSAPADGQVAADDARGMEAELFKDLTPTQLDLKHDELKGNFLELFNSTDNIIERINDIPSNESYMKIISFVSNQLNELRTMVVDYLSNVYSTKSYMENLMIYNRFLATLKGIDTILDEIGEDISKDDKDKELAEDHDDDKKEDKVDESVVLEFSGKSVLDPDFKDKKRRSLSSFKKVVIDKKFIDEYKSEYSDLKHCWPTDETHKSLAWVDKDKVVAFLSVSYPRDDGNSKYKGYNWISMISVMPGYRGCGLSKQILDVATKQLKANALTVNHNNEVAIKVYEDYGFKSVEGNHGVVQHMYLK